MHFGLYLHRKGVITADELVAALEVQTRRMVRIGQIALEECVLSARDIFDILQVQHRMPHERFGELAIKMGLMTGQDLMRLLMIQADRKLPVAEILVRQGVLTKEHVDEQLDAFRLIHERPRHAATTTTVVRPPHRRAIERAAADTEFAN